MIVAMLLFAWSDAATPDELFKQRVSSARVGVVGAKQGRYERHNFYTRAYVLWFDRWGPTLTIDLPGGPRTRRKRLVWDGENLVMTASGTSVPLPDHLEGAIRRVWDDLKLGLVDTQFTLLSTHRNRYTYKVDLPDGVASAYEIRLELNQDGRARGIAIGKDGKWYTGLGASEEYARLGLTVAWNVPYPDTIRSTAPLERFYPVVGAASAQRVRPQDYAWQDFHTVLPLRRVTSTSTASAVDVSMASCSVAQDFVDERFKVEWKVASSQISRIKDILRECPVVFDTTAFFRHRSPEGVKSCLKGAFQIQDGDGVVYATHQIDECSTAASTTEKSRVTSVAFPIPDVFTAHTLRVVFLGTASILCVDPQGQSARASAGVSGFHDPRLTWFGCYPDWNFSVSPE